MIVLQIPGGIGISQIWITNQLRIRGKACTNHVRIQGKSWLFLTMRAIFSLKLGIKSHLPA